MLLIDFRSVKHTLIAVGNFDQFAREQVPGLPGMKRIWPYLKRKDLLNLGLLLHDVGKYMGRGHVARGAMMVAPLAKRIGLSEEEEELVYFLVERQFHRHAIGLQANGVAAAE